MTVQSITIGYLLTLWISIGMCAILLITGWRRLASLMLAAFSLALCGWAFYSYEALQTTKLLNANALFHTASMLLIYLPPLFYHFICLMMKRAWQNRFVIMALYVLNFTFLNAIDFNNFTISNVNQFFVQFSIFSGSIVILYRTVFFLTLGMTFLSLVDAYINAKGYYRIRAHYAFVSIPIFIYGFMGAPGFSNLLFGLNTRGDSPLAFALIVMVMGYAITLHRMVELRRSALKFMLFLGLVGLFVWGNNQLTIFLLKQVGIGHFHYVHWVQTGVLTILSGALFLLYHWAQTTLRKMSGTKNHESIMLKIATQVLGGHGVDDAIRSALDAAREQFGVEQAAVLLKEAQGHSFVVRNARGIDAKQLSKFNFGKSLVGWITKHKEPFVMSEAEQTMSPSQFYQLTYSLRELPIEVCQPLLAKGNLVGLVMLGQKRRGALYTDKDLEILSGIGTILGTAIENSKLSDQAVIDGLTHLYHQRYFKNRLAEDIQVSNHVSSSMALIMVDIDHFKKLNDSYGHQAGDKVIESVASTLRQTVRSNDIVARYGGEEFAIYIQEGLSPARDQKSQDGHGLLKGAEGLAEKIRVQIEHNVIIYQDNIFNITVSVGVGFKSTAENKMTNQILIDRADQALYHSKKNGRNQTSVNSNKGMRQIPRSTTPPKRTERKQSNPSDDTGYL